MFWLLQRFCLKWMLLFISDKWKWKYWLVSAEILNFVQLTAISQRKRMCQFNAPMTISEIKHENVRCCLLPWRPWSPGLLASRWINCVIHFGLCSFGLCVPKLYFHLNLKWHCLHLKGISDPLKPVSLIQTFSNLRLHSLHFKVVQVNISSAHLVCVYQSCIFNWI